MVFGDFDGDGNDELVTATGGNTTVKVFDVTSDGRHGAQLYAFSGFPRGGAARDRGPERQRRRRAAWSAATGAPPRCRSGPTPASRACRPTSPTPSSPTTWAEASGSPSATSTTAAPRMSPSHQGQARSAGSACGSTSDGDLQIADNPITETFLAFDAAFNRGVSLSAATPENGGSNGASLVVGGGERREACPSVERQRRRPPPRRQPRRSSSSRTGRATRAGSASPQATSTTAARSRS